MHSRPGRHREGHDPPRPDGLHFVLHLHRFHHHDSLPCFHLVARRDKHAYHSTRHGRNDTLPPFSLAVISLPIPAARIEDLGAKTSPANPDSAPIRPNFIAAPRREHRIHTGSNLPNVGRLLGFLLYIRLGAKAAGCFNLIPFQPNSPAVEQNQRYRNSPSLPSERQRELTGVDGGSLFCD